MLKKIINIILVFVLVINVLNAQSRNPKYEAYIEKYSEFAVQCQNEHHIPASITLAQGILESGAGESSLARECNNHFGIKCGSDWYGRSTRKDDDRPNECFRCYKSAKESYDDHAKFLQRQRYAFLFDYPITDYKSWAYGLKQAGYATDPKYADQLIKLIEQYHLQSLTLDSTLIKGGFVTEKDTAWQNTEDGQEITFAYEDDSYTINEIISAYNDHQSKRINGVRYIIANDGDTFASLAIYLNMYERTLRRYNDALDTRELKPGDIVYIYPKKNKASRKTPNYYFRANSGEDAWSISQKFGIKLKSLYKLNGIPFGTPLTTTQQLDLR